MEFTHQTVQIIVKCTYLHNSAKTLVMQTSRQGFTPLFGFIPGKPEQVRGYTQLEISSPCTIKKVLNTLATIQNMKVYFKKDYIFLNQDTQMHLM